MYNVLSKNKACIRAIHCDAKSYDVYILHKNI